MAKDLSPAKCVLLTIHYASEANIRALHSFTPTRPDALTPELILRILLTYLPEGVEPKDYKSYIEEVASRLYLDVEREDVDVDTSPVQGISEEQAKKDVKRLKLLEIKPPNFPPGASEDLFTQFLCHRAYRIDSETGLLNMIPQLLEPFLDRQKYLRTWYISFVLPLLRIGSEYYPNDETMQIGLHSFEDLDGKDTVDFLLKPASQTTPGQKSEVARDIKGLVGPWMYGNTVRKRRKLHTRRAPENPISTLTDDVRAISLDEKHPDHDWEHVYRWMVLQSRENFATVTQAVEDWDGPDDIDLGGLNVGNSNRYLDEDDQKKLEAQYAQAAFAVCYAAEADTQETIRGVHGILARLAMLLGFIPPPDLATSVELLPKIESHASALETSKTTHDLDQEALMEANHPLTTPKMETYMLLQMMVYSAYLSSGLDYPISIVNAAKLHFYATAEEQLQVLQKILRGLSKASAKRDDIQWTSDRKKLLWLWNWGIEGDDNATTGAGLLGRIQREDFEEEMLKCFTETNCYQIAIDLYLKSSGGPMPKRRVSEIVLMKAMEAYDGASNGNRTRGGMKKANDIVSTFRPYFTDSTEFRQAAALISATHAVSYYSLTLQHGVPFQPVSIRASQDPIGLISTLLEQNPGSYTKLDDLIDIGRNLVFAGLPQRDTDSTDVDSKQIDADEMASKRRNASSRVTFMAIQASLQEDDFETAYSYIVSRLTPSAVDIQAPTEKSVKSSRHTRNAPKYSTRSKAAESDDDVSWRAAFLAGRYRPAASSPPTLRRLEQRTELLSLALLVAPVSALTDILAAWRRAEEELTSLQHSQQQDQEEFDDHADKRQSVSSIPGGFVAQGDQPALIFNQKRREMGRMTGKGGDEAPMSMFDLTRGAAQAFSRNAFPLRASMRSSSSQEPGGMEGSVGSLGSDVGEDGQQRVRKRDMVANAVSGGLASGLGWVLGATPVQRADDQ